MGYLTGNFAPQVKNWARFVAVNEIMRRCHDAMRDSLADGPGGFLIGLPLSMQEYEAVPGYEVRLESFRAEMEDKYLLSREGDDYIGVQCYTKLTLGPDGIVRDPEGETIDMGYRFWPQCVEYTVKRVGSHRTSGHCDRKWHRYRRRPPAHSLSQRRPARATSPPRRRVRRFAAIFSGPCSTILNGHSVIVRSSAWSRWIESPLNARKNPRRNGLRKAFVISLQLRDTCVKQASRVNNAPTINAGEYVDATQHHYLVKSTGGA